MVFKEACPRKVVLQIIQRVKNFFGIMKNEMFYERRWNNISIENL